MNPFYWALCALLVLNTTMCIKIVGILISEGVAR